MYFLKGALIIALQLAGAAIASPAASGIPTNNNLNTVNKLGSVPISKDTPVSACNIFLNNAHGNTHDHVMVAKECGSEVKPTLQFQESATDTCVVTVDTSITGCKQDGSFWGTDVISMKAGADGTEVTKGKGITMKGCAEGSEVQVQEQLMCCTSTPGMLQSQCM